ncbi:hypothetical protein CEXT_374591 [Caerostris extrusa]|uniref:Uncharacterized protein n=1 Tax=Caerostris extrusa TaxID=172846 RepID=A0AAV4N078_CAEEX|nr:hypothetical protein CEXT_374591 [Caerostris extrusa]
MANTEFSAVFEPDDAISGLFKRLQDLSYPYLKHHHFGKWTLMNIPSEFGTDILFCHLSSGALVFSFLRHLLVFLETPCSSLEHLLAFYSLSRAVSLLSTFFQRLPCFVLSPLGHLLVFFSFP